MSFCKSHSNSICSIFIIAIVTLIIGCGKENLTIYIPVGVVNPGNIQIEKGARTLDAIKKAGDFSANADKTSVYGAHILTDGETINIALKEVAPSNLAKNLPDTLPSTDKIDINTATKDDLIRLPGIGKSRAEAIIQYRQNNPFKSIDDLKKVPNIGEKIFKNIQPFVIVN